MIRVSRAFIPAVTADQMREIDRAMVEELHIELIQMMENAGRALADLAIRLFHPRTVTVLAGPGGNGGGGLVAARHLANRGVSVHVVLSHPKERLVAVSAHQLDIVRRMGLVEGTVPNPGDMVIDALIGYSLRGNPAGAVAELVKWANDQAAPVLALDAPTGLDATDGTPSPTCIRAAATLTLALPKTGLLRAPHQVGRLFVADISVPPFVYRRLGIEAPPLFSRDTIIEVGD